MSAQILLLEMPDGNVVAYVANSPEAADRVREVSRYEVVGTARRVTLAEAIG